MSDLDKRPQVIVHTDHNPDEVRSFYEVPGALVNLIRPSDDERTFVQALADLVHAESLASGSDPCPICGRDLNESSVYDDHHYHGGCPDREPQ